MPPQIDLDLTPQEAMACQEIRKPEDLERLRQLRAGKSYFFVDVASFSAYLAIMRFDARGHSCRAERLSAEEQERVGISDEMLLLAVAEAGGAINMSGHYPISEEIREILASGLAENRKSEG